jgi:hypothetical protein
MLMILMETYKPDGDERSEFPGRLWYFDYPELFYNSSYRLTTDHGTSLAHLVEAANTTHWEFLAHTYHKSNNFQSCASISYVNAYSQGGCVPDWF